MPRLIVDKHTGSIHTILTSAMKYVEVDNVPVEPESKENVTYELKYSDEKGLYYEEKVVVVPKTTEAQIEELSERLRSLEKIASVNPSVPNTVEPGIGLDIINELGGGSPIPSPQDIPEPPKEKEQTGGEEEKIPAPSAPPVAPPTGDSGDVLVPDLGAGGGSDLLKELENELMKG